MRDRKYETRVALTINVEADKLKRYREICHRNGVSISERFNEFIDEELKKAEGIANPLAIPYGKSFADFNNTMRQTTLSLFAASTTNVIEEELTGMEDRKLLVVLEGKGHHLKYSARKRIADLDFNARIRR